MHHSNQLTSSNKPELMKQIESWTFWRESFRTAACFIHHKYVLTRRSFIFQCGHWETDLKTPQRAGKWLIPTTHLNSGSAQEPNRQRRYELIPRKAEHMSLTNVPDAWVSSPSQTFLERKRQKHFNHVLLWKYDSNGEFFFFCSLFFFFLNANISFALNCLVSAALNRLFGSGLTLDEWLRSPRPNHPSPNPRQWKDEVMC